MRLKNNKGFTFIELVLYMGILSIFMVAVVTLVSSTAASHKKLNARKRLQTQASETYDSIADILMGASDVKVWGSATIEGAVKNGAFVLPDADGNTPPNCYDLTKVASFGLAGSPSSDETTFIRESSTDHTVKLYLKYASDIDASGDTVQTYCTITYSSYDKCIKMFRSTNPSVEGLFMLATEVLCTDVEDFYLQVSPETGSIAINLKLLDDATNQDYEIKGVVGLRNSYVLQKHEWN